MIGAIAADIIGSIYEFENHKSKDFPLFGEFSAFTDDCLCTIAVADCLMNQGNPAEYLRRWGQKYWKLRWHVLLKAFPWRGLVCHGRL